MRTCFAMILTGILTSVSYAADSSGLTSGLYLSIDDTGCNVVLRVSADRSTITQEMDTSGARNIASDCARQPKPTVFRLQDGVYTWELPGIEAYLLPYEDGRFARIFETVTTRGAVQQRLIANYHLDGTSDQPRACTQATDGHACGLVKDNPGHTPAAGICMSAPSANNPNVSSVTCTYGTKF
jgi:hypothetical protein